MKIRHCFIAAGMLFALLAASVASAQTSCGNNDFQLLSDTSSQGLLVAGNSGYRGSITSGNMAPGAWSIKIDDTGWPTSTNTRRTYVKSNFYTYDAANRVFRAVFPMNKVQIQLVNQQMLINGAAQLTMEAADADNDGVFDNTEFNGAQTVIASVDAPCGSTTPICGGPGSANGSANGDGPVTAPLIGALLTQPCAVAVEQDVWGDVKMLFRD